MTPGAFRTQPPTEQAVAYAAKLNPSGSALVYSTLLGGTGADAGSAIRIDAQGNAYVLGTTSSTDFPVTSGALQASGPSAPWTVANSTIGSFLTAFNPAGTALVYSTYLSGAAALDVDLAGNAWVLGTASYGFPVTAGAFQRCMSGGYSDLFAAQFTPGGKLAGASYLGGTGGETGAAIAASADGRPYIAGETYSIDFPGITGAVSAESLSFVAKIQIDNAQAPGGPCISQGLENGASFMGGPVAGGEIVTIRGAGHRSGAGRFGTDRV